MISSQPVEFSILRQNPTSEFVFKMIFLLPESFDHFSQSANEIFMNFSKNLHKQWTSLIHINLILIEEKCVRISREVRDI